MLTTIYVCLSIDGDGKMKKMSPAVTYSHDGMHFIDKHIKALILKTALLPNVSLSEKNACDGLNARVNYELFLIG